MNTKEIIIICLTLIIVAMIAGGAILMTNSGKDIENPVNNNTTTSNESNNVTAERLSYDDVKSDDDSDIVSEYVEYSEHYGGYLRQVNYKDGGFRQFDANTGELVGSSYDSDQKYLPSME